MFICRRCSALQPVSCFRHSSGWWKEPQQGSLSRRAAPSPFELCPSLVGTPISLSASSTDCPKLPLQFLLPVMSFRVWSWDLPLLCTEINGISSASLQWTCWISNGVYSSASLASRRDPDACRSQPVFGIQHFSFYSQYSPGRKQIALAVCRQQFGKGL